MATIANTRTDLRGIAIVTSGTMANGDDSAPATCDDFRDITGYVRGTPGVGFSLNWQISLDGTNWRTVATVTATGLTSFGGNGMSFTARYARAQITAGDGTTAIVAELGMRKYR